MTTELVNLTPHQLVIYSDDGDSVELDASVEPARVQDRRPREEVKATAIGSVRLVDVERASPVVGLPSAREDVVLVVSRVTAAEVAREDLAFPLDEVRDEDGRVIGCRSLGRFVSSSSTPRCGGER